MHFFSSLLPNSLTIYLSSFFTVLLLLLSLLSFTAPVFFSQSLSFALSLDTVSFWIVYLSLLLLLLSVFISFIGSIPNSIPWLLILFFSSLIVFLTSNFITLYFFFELSLLPISFIIANWGTYSERCLSVEYILVYTVFFSFPIILVVSSFSVFCNILTFSSFSLSNSGSFWISILVIMSFLVNLPVYSVHYWLPQAHVEAPTLGSIILASILLNLGGYSLYRMYPLFALGPQEVYLLCSFLLVSLLFSSIHTSQQSDFNRLIAYSSVVHISPIPILVFLSGSLSPSTLGLLIYLHGLSSPLLFYLVSTSYAFFGSRNLVLTSSCLIYSVPVVLFLVLAFLFNLPAPPFLSFLSEVLLFVPIVYNFCSFSIFFIMGAVILSLVFNLSWFIPNVVLFNSSIINTPLSLYRSTSPFFLIPFLFLSILFLFSVFLFSQF